MENDRYTISLKEWYDEYALEIELTNDNSFKLTRETLERVGVLSNNGKTLYQSCNIFFKRGKYYIVHFKELFAIDGRLVNLSDEDIKRRNLIASLLEEWGLITIINGEGLEKLNISSIKVIKNIDREKYNFVSKYQIGNVGINNE